MQNVRHGTRVHTGSARRDLFSTATRLVSPCVAYVFGVPRTGSSHGALHSPAVRYIWDVKVIGSNPVAPTFDAVDRTPVDLQL